MIQVYKPGNTRFHWNGDAVLQPFSCTLSMELNGAWELSLEAPLDEEGRFLELVAGAVISAPTPMGAGQRFRIYDAEKSDSGVTVRARPVFLDAARDVFLLRVSCESLSATQALSALFSGTRYKFTTDLTSFATALYERQNLIQALTGETSGFLTLWGGELDFDNETVRILRRQGADRGFRVEFGRNISAIRETINTENLATRLIPVAFNGRMLPGDAPWVDSPLLDNYPLVHIAELDCSDLKLKEDLSGEPQDGDTVCETLEALHAAMRARCEAEFASGRDKPTVTYEVDMVELSGTEEYADFKELETVHLGDTVHCKHRRLGIETAARVIALEYDCIRRRNSAVTLGDYRSDILTTVSNLDTKLSALTGGVSTIPGIVKKEVTAATSSIALGGEDNRSLSISDPSGALIGAIDSSGVSLQRFFFDGKAVAWKTLADGTVVLARSN